MNPADDLNRVQTAVLRDVTDEIGRLGFEGNLLNEIIKDKSFRADFQVRWAMLNATAQQRAQAYRTLTGKEIK